MRRSRDARRGLFVGLSTVDLAYRVEFVPGPNAKASASSQQIGAGGPATNAAITFSFLSGKSALLSGVGQHAISSVIRRELDQFSICLHDLAAGYQDAPPVSSILVLPNGERTIVSANARAFGAVDPNIKETWLEGVDLVLMDGHFMPVCQAIAGMARQKGIEVVLDGGSWKEGTAELLRHVDTAICSNDFRPPGCRDERDTMSFLRDQGIERIAITRGAGPIFFENDGVTGEIPVATVEEIDTSGAGDVFHGAFCYRFAQADRDFVGSLQFAARVATFSCGYAGTRSWMEAFREGPRGILG